MKVQKMFTIEQGIALQLSNEPNASKLISELLEGHYKSEIPQSTEEIKNRIAMIELEERQKKEREELLNEQRARATKSETSKTGNDREDQP